MSWIKESVIKNYEEKYWQFFKGLESSPLCEHGSYLLSAKYEVDQVFLSLLAFHLSVSFLPNPHPKPHNPCSICEVLLLAWHGI